MDYEGLTKKLDTIETELRRLGYLTGPVGPAKQVHSAFGQGEMGFTGWLADVFLPRAREAIATRHLPSQSNVGTMAIRELDGNVECSDLVTLLCEFDQIVEES
jgi:uncharacterized protein YqcC (DUF446 family)